MYRSQPRRRRSTVTASRRPRTSRRLAGPFVAFLLIACFGMLFTGCTSNKIAIKGPDASDTQLQDVTFTQQDLEKFHELSGSSVSSDGATTELSANQTGATMAHTSAGTVELSMTDATGAVLPGNAPILDLSMTNTYMGLRESKGATGPNIYKVVNTFLKVRKDANAKSAQVATLYDGDSVTLVQFANADWAKVQMKDGTQGFVSGQYIARFTTQDKVDAEKKAFDGMYYVSFAFVNVRSAPDPKSEKLGQIPGKQILGPLEVINGWAKVQFQGKEGYVSTDYLTKFIPKFLVTQNSYQLPIFVFDFSDNLAQATLLNVAAQLKAAGVKLTTLRDFRAVLLDQQKRDFVFTGKHAVLAIRGLSRENTLKMSNALTEAGVPATLFVETKDVGISGITQKTLLRLLANGFDIQSGGHTGEDLRALTTAQVKLEIEQSRKILEDATAKPVFAIAYAQGGANERVVQLAGEAGYLFGVGTSPAASFTREDLLQLPSYPVSSSMEAADVVKLVK